METQEIYNILQKDPKTRKSCGGVLPSDQLPPKPDSRDLDHDIFFVINLDPSTKPGSHWVVCYFRNNNIKPLYFDSYGFPPTIDSIKDFVGEDYEHNTRAVQHPLSTSCGQWCIFFVYHQIYKNEMGKNVKTFKQRFSKSDLLKNDHEINHWINTVFGVENKVIERDFLCNQISQSKLAVSEKFDYLYD